MVADREDGVAHRKSHVAVFSSSADMVTGLFKRPSTRRGARAQRPPAAVVEGKVVDAAPPTNGRAHNGHGHANGNGNGHANGHERPAAGTLEEWQASTVPRTVAPVPGAPQAPQLSAELETAMRTVIATGVLDYEELAAAMRRVLERERDEIVKNGGPFEKLYAEVKNRLGEQTEQTQLWRERARVAAEQRNEYQKQLDDQISKNRELRRDMNQLKTSGKVKVKHRDIKEILRVVAATPPWDYKMQGNGHYGIYKEGVFISDAASSGGSTRVDMATLVKLRKAGLDV